MPSYDLTCGHMQYLSFERFDELKAKDWPTGTCDKKCVDSRPTSSNMPTFYGAWRISDKTFRDAEEASGQKVSSTKDIDRLEREGICYPITNPSRHRSVKG